MLHWLKRVLARDFVFSVIEVVVVIGVILAAVTVVLMARGAELPGKQANETSQMICPASPPNAAAL